MRKLMWVGIGFALACLFGAYVLSGLWLLIIGICLLPVSIVLFVRLKEHRRIRCICMMLAATAVGFIWFFVFTQFSLAVPRAVDGTVQQITATASDYSYDTRYGVSVEAKVRTGPITNLNCTQTIDGKLKFIITEAESTDGPIMTIR